MARRPHKLDVNLFPFLSVLCSVVGVLILFMLLIMSTRVVDSEDRVQPYGTEKNEAGDNGLSMEDAAALQEMVQRASARLAARQQDLGRLLKMRKRLRELLALKKDAIEQAKGDGTLLGVHLDPAVNIEMQEMVRRFDGKSPRFIEADFDGYLVYPEKRHFAVNDLVSRDEQVRKNHRPTTPMEEFFEQAYRRREREYVVFLIRPSGIEAFDRARHYLCGKYPRPDTQGKLSEVDMGWEPISTTWKLAN